MIWSKGKNKFLVTPRIIGVRSYKLTHAHKNPTKPNIFTGIEPFKLLTFLILLWVSSFVNLNPNFLSVKTLLNLTFLIPKPYKTLHFGS